MKKIITLATFLLIFNISKSGKRKGTEGEKSYGLGLNNLKISFYERSN